MSRRETQTEREVRAKSPASSAETEKAQPIPLSCAVSMASMGKPDSGTGLRHESYLRSGGHVTILRFVCHYLMRDRVVRSH